MREQALNERPDTRGARGVARLVERAFGDLPFRALWLTALGTMLLVVYHHQGSPAWAAPRFLALSESLTGC